jgi:hypothetical protein
VHTQAEQYFWLDVLCVDVYEAATFSSANWSETFATMVRSIGHTLLCCVPALEPCALTRSWCVWELCCTLLKPPACALTLLTTAADKAALADVSGYGRAITHLRGMDSARAGASLAADKERIDAAIVAAGGHGVITSAVRGRLLAELLGRAVERGSDHFDVIQALCEAGANVKMEVGTYRVAALAGASSPRVSLVERQRLKKNGKLDEIRKKDAEVVAYLLSRGANVDAQSSKTGDSALICASRYGDAPAVATLLGARADPNLAQRGLNEGESAFLTAARWGSPNVLPLLAAAGANVNATYLPPFLGYVASAAMWSSMYANADNLRVLHECKCDLAYVNPTGESALSLAMAKAEETGDEEPVQFLRMALAAKGSHGTAGDANNEGKKDEAGQEQP